MITETGRLGSAVFSDCYQYRYALHRNIEPIGTPLGQIAFLMLNPSQATADINDPTVAKCGTYAAGFGGTSLTVINIFAYRSTDPNGLKETADPIGAENDEFIEAAVQASAMTICAWGRHGALMNRGRLLTRRLLDNHAHKLFYLHLNQDGSPGHPLYLPLSRTASVWTNAREYANGDDTIKRRRARAAKVDSK